MDEVHRESIKTIVLAWNRFDVRLISSWERKNQKKRSYHPDGKNISEVGLYMKIERLERFWHSMQKYK